jgi:hypothetical protein
MVTMAMGFGEIWGGKFRALANPFSFSFILFFFFFPFPAGGRCYTRLRGLAPAFGPHRVFGRAPEKFLVFRP